MLITPEQLAEIRQIVADHHEAFIASAIGVDAVAPEVLERLKAQGLVDVSVTSIEDAYLYGQVLALLESPAAASMNYQEFREYVRRNPIPPSAIERQAVAIAAQQAGQYCRGLGNRVNLATGQVAIEADQELRARLEDDIRTAVSEGLARRDSVKKIKSTLGWATKDWARDLDRIINTEVQTAMQQGEGDHLRERYGAGVRVSKVPMEDACEHCKRLFRGSDGQPRIFRLAELQANGTNAGRRAADWRPVVGAVHPHCQCQLIRVPEGWGYDEDGDLVPGGKLGEEADSEDFAKAQAAEEKLHRPHSRTTFQGLRIAIENPAGSIRRWTDEQGNTGETRMLYPYGYIEGTNGTDEDELDVFLGPDETEPMAYVCHQQNPTSGLYDEEKIMLGFPSPEEAVRAYRAHYNRDDFLIAVSPLSVEHLKRWAAHTEVEAGAMAKGAEPRLVIRAGSDDLEKGEARGGKYIRRVPYTDRHGKRKFRYYYRESAMGRGARAGEDVRLGDQLVKIEEVSPDGTVTYTEAGQRKTVTPGQWADIMAQSYGTKYHEYAERRARSVIRAVLRHVPREQLADLRGSTDAERLADLKTRVPAVWSKLKASFKRTGMTPFQAKQLIGYTLERRGWEPEARAVVIGSVFTEAGAQVAKNYRQIARGAKSLAGGKPVKAAHVQTAIELRRPKLDQVAKAAERELAKLQKLLVAAAGEGRQAEAAGVLAQAMAMASKAIQEMNALATAYPGTADPAAEAARKALLAVPAAMPRKAPTTQGAAGVVFVAGEGGKPEGLNARYVLMEAGKVIASHDPSEGFRKNPGYPEGVQERAYHRDKAEQLKVIRNSQRMLPALVINTNPDAVNGPPIVTADGIVLGGNSRAMSMQVAYDQASGKDTELKQYLADHAHEVGLTPEDVQAMERPILVRVVDVPPEKKGLQLLVRQMNESFTQAMDPRTAQVAMGRRLSDGAIDSMARAMNDDETLNAFLSSSRARPFLGDLNRSGVIDERNVNQYVKNGRLNADGKVLVSRILVGRMIDNADLLSEIPPRLMEAIAQSVPFMVRAKGHGTGFDLSEPLQTALDALASLQEKAESGTIDALDPKMPEAKLQHIKNNYFADMFGNRHPVMDDPRANAILDALIRKPGPRQLSAVFKEYSKIAAANPEGQGGMFGPPMTPVQALQQALETAGKREKEDVKPAAPAQGTLAASMRPQRSPVHYIPVDYVQDGVLHKALYIGPRGGKWADPQHTIPWSPEHGGEQLTLFGATSGTGSRAEKARVAVISQDPALTDEQKAKPRSAALNEILEKVDSGAAREPEEWKLPAGARIDDPWLPPESPPDAKWSHPDLGSGTGRPPWEQSDEWHPDFSKFDYIVINSSAGKDSQATLSHVVAQADRAGYPRSKIIVVHADLGRIDWEGTATLARQQAEKYGLRFEVVQRQQGDLVEQIDERHGDLVQKDADVAAILEATGVRTWAEFRQLPEKRIAEIIGEGKGTSKWGGPERAKRLLRNARDRVRTLRKSWEKKLGKARDGLAKARAAEASAKSDRQRQQAAKRVASWIGQVRELEAAGDPNTRPVNFGKAIAWPDAGSRFCTSDHKRTVINQFHTRLADEHRKKTGTSGEVRILNALGIRAQESPGRRAMAAFARDTSSSSSRKVIDDWFPIHRWHEKKVWQKIAESGVPFHRAYRLGMRRLSCVFCVFASREDLLIAATHNPELFKTYLELEEKIGTEFRLGQSLAAIADEIAKRRSEGLHLNELAEWVKALGAGELLKADAVETSDAEVFPANLLLEAALIRLAEQGQTVAAVTYEWKSRGACLHLDTDTDSHHVAFVPYPQAYNASLMAAAFAGRKGLDFEEHNPPAPQAPAEDGLEKAVAAGIVEIPKGATVLDFPDSRQYGDFDCGAAAFQSVLRYYGIDRNGEELVKELRTTRADGTKVSDLVRVAKKYGLTAVSETMTIEDVKRWIDRGVPVIMPIQAWPRGKGTDLGETWEEGHYVVAIGYGEGRLYFDDPALLGSRGYLPFAEMEARWHDKDSDRRYEHWGIALRGRKPQFDSEQAELIKAVIPAYMTGDSRQDDHAPGAGTMVNLLFNVPERDIPDVNADILQFLFPPDMEEQVENVRESMTRDRTDWEVNPVGSYNRPPLVIPAKEPLRDPDAAARRRQIEVFGTRNYGLTNRDQEFMDKAAAEGPYIGPRGGEWADPQHTIPWDPKKHGRVPGSRLESEKRAIPDRLPPGKTAREHVMIARKVLRANAKALPAIVQDLKRIAGEGGKVRARVKTLQSALGKLARKPDEYPTADKLQDCSGTRLVHGTVAEVQESVRKLKAAFPVIEEEDLMTKPRGNYRSVHLILKDPRTGIEFECQVRTKNQDEFAYWAHNVYKPLNETQEKYKDHPDVASYEKQMADYFWAADQGHDPPPPPKPPCYQAVQVAFGCI